jgi:hypothetical protein
MHVVTVLVLILVQVLQHPSPTNAVAEMYCSAAVAPSTLGELCNPRHLINLQVSADQQQSSRAPFTACVACRSYSPGDFVSVNLPSKEGPGRGDA